MPRRHTITILIRYAGNGSPSFVPPEISFDWEIGENCTHDEFYCHQVPLTYMAVFRQARLEPESLGPELSALKTYCGLGFHLCLMYYVSRKLFQKKKRILAIFALKSPKNRNFYIIILQYHKNELKFHIEYFNIFEKINKMCTIKSKWKNLECLHWTFRTFDCKTSLNQWVFQYINNNNNKNKKHGVHKII